MADALTGGDWLSRVAGAWAALDALKRHRDLCASLEGPLRQLSETALPALRRERSWQALVALRRVRGELPHDPLADIEVLLREQADVLAASSDPTGVPAAVSALCALAEDVLSGSALRFLSLADLTARRPGRADGARLTIAEVQSAAQRLRGMSELVEASRPQGFPANGAAGGANVPGALVSIIVVAFNNTALAELCVASVLASSAGATWELIVVNNAAPDLRLAALSRLDVRIRLVDIGANRGFGEACNIAAERARGTHLVFLNADAFVSDGWLAVLLDAYEGDLAVGLLAATLICTDGTVQEAGCRVDSAARVWQNGRGEDQASLAEGRSVDAEHVSAACSMISKELFELLGGFDWRYFPAYCEDLDLSLKVRAAGLRVMYNEAVRVVHLEHGGDSSPLAMAGVRDMVEANRRKLVRKWGIDDIEPVADRYLGLDAVARTDRVVLRDRHARRHPSGAPEAVPGCPGSEGPFPRYAVHTTLDLTPGDEQAALLEHVARLADTGAQVTLVSAAPWSRLRLIAVCEAVGCMLPALQDRLGVASEADVAVSDFDAVYRLGESGLVEDLRRSGW